jgi:hypothetical protein
VRRYPSLGEGVFEETFYTDRRTPAKDPIILRLCENTLARFALGRDVRRKLRQNKGKSERRVRLIPVNGGRYAPENMIGSYTNYMERYIGENEVLSVEELLA